MHDLVMGPGRDINFYNTCKTVPVISMCVYSGKTLRKNFDLPYTNDTNFCYQLGRLGVTFNLK